jgi:hypothetical protein
MTNRWDTSGMPHKGWTCDGVEDLREDDPEAPLASCEMCGKESIRYVHSMRHTSHSEMLEVGCVCAEKMAIGYDGKRAERTLRNRLSRRRTFLNSGWNPTKSGKGTFWKKKHGVFLLVGKGPYGYFAKVGDEFLPGSFATLDAAIIATFNEVDHD